MTDLAPDAAAHPHATSAPALGPDFHELAARFKEEGFVTLPGVVSHQVLKTLEDGLAAEFQSWQHSEKKFHGGGLLSGHLNCYPGAIARGALKELESKGILDLARRLQPADPKATRVGCNLNLPNSVPQHYHMDGVFLESFMIVNVAVVDTEVQNGAIDVIPKTHQRFYRFWEFATKRLNRGSTRLPMSRGDVLIRVSTLWHRGMPNFTKNARPMLAVTLGEKGVDNEDPLSPDHGGTRFDTNWFNPTKLGRLRERATIAAPITYSAYRFAHSLLSDKGYASF